MSSENAWLARFAQITCRKEIRRRAAMTPAPLRGLERLSTEDAGEAITVALKELFVVSEQALDILQLHVLRAFEYCKRVYPSEKVYVNRLYASKWELEHDDAAILMTGLAGSGKSEIARALRRVLPSDSEVFVGSSLQRSMPLESSAYVSIRSQATPRTALAHWLPKDVQASSPEAQDMAPPKPSGQRRLSDADVIDLVRYEYYRRGIGCAIGDEYQFITQSEGANSKLARMLLTLVYLSVPVTNILNFSACHKLVRRPQEERDRILPKIVHVVPETPGAADWSMLMSAYDRLLEEVLDFKMTDHAEVIWYLTAASKRTLRRLISMGYRVARDGKRTRIEVSDLERAFRMGEFTVLRSDVEATIEMLARGAPPKGRQDLWCPFGGNDWHKPSPATTPERAFEAKIAAAFVEESLSPEQRNELNRMRRTETAVLVGKVKSGAQGQKKHDSATLLRNSQIHLTGLKR